MSKSIKLKNNLYLAYSSLAANYCSMHVNGIITATPNEAKFISSYTLPINCGKFVANTSTGNLEIPKGTEAIEVTGMLCGSGNANARIRVIDEDNSEITYYNDISILIQPSGNTYWKQSLPSKIVELNKNKKHYVQLFISGYNGYNYNLNDGYGTGASWIQAKIIK